MNICGAFKTETRRGRKKDLTTWTHEWSGVNLTLKFTTSTNGTRGMGLPDKKYLYKRWLTLCILFVKNSDLHDVLRSNRKTGLFTGTKFLVIARAVLDKGNI